MRTIEDLNADAGQLEIEHLLSEFSRCVDQGDAEGLSRLFMPDGVLGVGGQEVNGQAAIGADLERRFQTPGRKTRHVWSNLRVVAVDGETVETAAVQLTFEQAGADKPTQLRISDLSDVLRRDAQGNLRFARRTISRQMSLNFAD